MGLSQDTLGYGETKERAVAETIGEIAPLFEKQAIASVEIIRVA